MSAIDDVAAERKRQIEKEGWSHKHDDEHASGDMAWAAAAYCVSDEDLALEMLWPWERDWWKPKDYRANLVRAAALIVAEIERLDRAAARK